MKFLFRSFFASMIPRLAKQGLRIVDASEVGLRELGCLTLEAAQSNSERPICSLRWNPMCGLAGS